MSRPDFPRTIFEFQRQFNTEEACLKYLIASRWPRGFSCPRCGHDSFYWKAARKLLECKQCRYQASVTAGTVMHRSRQPLTIWFQAAYLVTTHTPGFSALQFQRQVGIPSYKTAFMMLHKLRAALVKEDREKLRGVVEVDETYVGGAEAGPGGRGARGKAIVVGAVEVRGERAGRIRLRVVKNVTGMSLEAFVQLNVEAGSTVRTDAFAGYFGLLRLGYNHTPLLGAKSSGLPYIHRVFSNLKSWLIGTHHGVSDYHLPAYLNEYVFRFNRRKTPMAAFQTALGLIGERKGPTYKGLYAVGAGGTEWEHPNPDELDRGFRS